MKDFKVRQLVLCEVSVWYYIKAESHEQALQIVANNKCPTSTSGVDYEINSDEKIIQTFVEDVK